MPIPQPGIFALGTSQHHQLELDLRDGVSDVELAAAIASLREPPMTAGSVNLVVGFGPEAWRRLADVDAQPPSFGRFEPIGAAPATQHDIWVWVHGSRQDMVFDVARACAAALAEVATVAAELPCFLYHDSRDMTGFEDGTENPSVEEAFEVALVPDGEDGAGGSFVLAQRWVHDLVRFHRLSVEEQQDVIGRTKPDSEELGDDVKPPTAHIARVVIEDDEGEEIEIWRRSVPYGTVTEMGLFFLAFAADQQRFKTMLGRMFGQAGDGLHDRLTDFSTPVSGSFYFAPSVAALRAIGKGTS